MIPAPEVLLLDPHDSAHPGSQGHGHHALGHERCGVPGVHVTEFMPRQGGQFGFVVELEEDPPGGGDAPPRKGIGVDVGGVDGFEGIGHLRPVGVGDQALSHGGDIVLEGGVLDRTVVDGKLVGGMLFVDADLLPLGHEHQLGFSGHRVGGAAHQESGGRQGPKLYEISTADTGFSHGLFPSLNLDEQAVTIHCASICIKTAFGCQSPAVLYRHPIVDSQCRLTYAYLHLNVFSNFLFGYDLRRQKQSGNSIRDISRSEMRT